MVEPGSFEGLKLRGGFVLARLELVAGPLADALGRSALAKTTISGRTIKMTMVSSLSDQEKSVTLYHEILEALTVASSNPARFRAGIQRGRL